MNRVKNIPQLPVLREDFGKNKKIPPEFEKVILRALFYFPELRKTPIVFSLRQNCEELYRTEISFSHFLKKSSPRFIITFKNAAPEPERQALFKNLPPEAQLGALAHQLGQVVYLNKQRKGELFRISFLDVSLKKEREMERAADIIAIEHGLGQELYAFATYLHSIPGLLERKKHLQIYRLSPNEILQGLSEKELGMDV